MRENLTSGSMRGSRGGSLGRYGETDYALHSKGWRQGSSTPGTAGVQPILFPTLHTNSVKSSCQMECNNARAISAEQSFRAF